MDVEEVQNMILNNIKKTLIALATVAFAVAMPVTVKADAALDQAAAFAKMQNNYLNATTTYFTQYEVPVMNQYNMAMSDQISQALAANWQANLMYQQALQRQAVNQYQVAMNYDTMMLNLNTQYQNLMNNSMYAFQTNMNTLYGANLENVNKLYGYSMGQSLFPQAQ